MIIVSACLAGIRCKYDGTYNTVPSIQKMVEEGRAVPVCPELLGGSPVPREPNEIVGGTGMDVLEGRARVLNPSGHDHTELFVLGAEKTLEIALRLGVREAILKQRSPSCGSTVIYDGTFKGKKVSGMGVAAALLMKSGLKVYSEENFEQAGLNEVAKTKNE